MRVYNWFLLFLGIAAFSALAGCEGKSQKTADTPPEAAQEIVPAAPVCRWFCFSQAGFSEIDVPQNAPPVSFVPWTEAVRVNGAGISGAPAFGSSWFLVNHLGLLALGDAALPEQYLLIRDEELFSDRTAANLTLIQNVPFIHLYRNDFFSSKTGGAHPVLVRYAGEARAFIPVFEKSDLAIPTPAEVIDLIFDGSLWHGAVKQTVNSRITYRYLSVSAKGAVSAQSAEVFRSQKRLLPLSRAPDRLRALLGAIPEELSFEIICVSSETTGALVYQQGPVSDFPPDIQGTAVIAPLYAVSLFADGTVYFAGLLRHTDGGDRFLSRAFRMPALPPGFVYGYCAVSGNTLFASWEEADFYETGRSGFAAFDLGSENFKK